MQRPIEDRYLLSQSELQARLAVMMGGRAAEALVFDEISTGASDDLARATDLARRMVSEFGMSPTLGPVRLAGDPQAYLGPQFGLDSRVSQQAAGQVDIETRRLVEEALTQASGVLEGQRAVLDWLAERLYEHETVNGSEVTAMLARSAAPAGLPARRSVPMRVSHIVVTGMNPSVLRLPADSDLSEVVTPVASQPRATRAAGDDHGRAMGSQDG